MRGRAARWLGVAWLVAPVLCACGAGTTSSTAGSTPVAEGFARIWIVNSEVLWPGALVCEGTAPNPFHLQGVVLRTWRFNDRLEDEVGPPREMRFPALAPGETGLAGEIWVRADRPNHIFAGLWSDGTVGQDVECLGDVFQSFNVHLHPDQDFVVRMIRR